MGLKSRRRDLAQTSRSREELELLQTVPNPWGQVPATDGGRSLTPTARGYLERLLGQQDRDTPSRRHHYVPRAYLKEWSSDGKRIWALNTGSGEAKLVGVADACVKENFHRVLGPGGEPHNRVELLFGVVDAELRRVQQLLNQIKTGDALTFDDFLALGVTMAVQRMRTLQQRRLHHQRSEWYAAQTSRERSSRDDLDDPRFMAGVHTETIFNAMWEAADLLTTRQLEIWEDTNGRFITSDVPVIVPFKSGVRPSLLTASRVVWPISPHRAVILSNELQGKRVVFPHTTKRMVEAIRADIIRGRERLIFATEDGLRHLPVGRSLRRRAQMRLRCSQRSPDGEYVAPPACFVEVAECYATSPDVRLCNHGLHFPAPGMEDYA